MKERESPRWPRSRGRAAHAGAPLLERGPALALGEVVRLARFLLAHTRCRSVVDPFCGVKTMLAVANGFRLDARGVERSPKRAERARRLLLDAR